jgi:hypothetical protein
VQLRIAYCVLCVGAQASIDRCCVLRIAYPHCVSEVWQVLTDAVYCVLRIRIAYQRFGRYWEGLRIAYCVLRIAYWRFGRGCVLRIAYPHCVSEVWEELRIAYCVSALRIGGLGGVAYCVLRIAYCVLEVWEGLRIAYCVSALRIGGLGGVAYCVLRIRIAYWRFGRGCVLRIAYCVLRIAYSAAAQLDGVECEQAGSVRSNTVN